MTDRSLIHFTFNGVPVEGREGSILVAALWAAGITTLRCDASGGARGLYCEIGHCFECRVTVDGIAHERGCQLLVRDGMEVTTDAA